eukprot:1158641-Pelagomonas_calceolata.AAC.9
MQTHGYDGLCIGHGFKGVAAACCHANRSIVASKVECDVAAARMCAAIVHAKTKGEVKVEAQEQTHARLKGYLRNKQQHKPITQAANECALTVPALIVHELAQQLDWWLCTIHLQYTVLTGIKVNRLKPSLESLETS